ncbi:unnamed protein product [Timema podura]|uniref:Uncharacterized protein n=1 Tax=Timema podura TaxID=61482 RepID=A0ABN7PIF7_TIMPD|nr:unnamed protein product [Timema podura]
MYSFQRISFSCFALRRTWTLNRLYSARLTNCARNQRVIYPPLLGEKGSFPLARENGRESVRQRMLSRQDGKSRETLFARNSRKKEKPLW